MIRKIQYSISYYHILSFFKDYIDIVSPFFGYENLGYNIEKANTRDEHIRLIFNNFNTIILCSKDSLGMLYEGDDKSLLEEGSILSEFFILYEKISKLKNFNETLNQSLTIHFVNKKKEIECSDLLTVLPEESINDFAVNYVYNFHNHNINLKLGGFMKDDVENLNMSPFKTEYNADLLNLEKGILYEVKVNEKTNKPSMGSLKSILKTAKIQIEKIDEKI